MSRRVVWGVVAVAVGLAAIVAVLVRDPTPEVVEAPSPDPSPTASPRPGPSPTAASTPAGGPSPTRTSPTPDTGPVEIEPREIATDLVAPWAVAFTADGTAYVSERDTGRVLALRDGATEEVQRVDVDPTGEGGLLGLVAGPDGEQLYAYYSSVEGDNRIARFAPGDDPEPILTGIPHGSVHNGGRLVFGPDGMLYVGTGDAGEGGRAQDPESLGGKILRVDPDGEAPDDNPSDSPVWSLGHRNVQGLAFDGDGQLWASEFGPDRDDEVNRIEAGANYGWPDVTGEAGQQGFVDPVFVRQPSDASWTGIAILTGGAIPQWEGDLFAASLRGERLYRLQLSEGDVTDDAVLLDGELGRLRASVQAPDGSLWVLTNNRDGRGSPREGDDRIVRLGP